MTCTICPTVLTCTKLCASMEAQLEPLPGPSGDTTLDGLVSTATPESHLIAVEHRAVGRALVLQLIDLYVQSSGLGLLANERSVAEAVLVLHHCDCYDPQRAFELAMCTYDRSAGLWCDPVMFCKDFMLWAKVQAKRKVQ